MTISTIATVKTHECPKCLKRMDPGHIPDVAHGTILQSSWMSGLAEKRRYLGGIKYERKRLVPLTAYRCPRCGLVELYAEG